MAKKKQPKYIGLPHCIYLQPNNRYQNTRTGKWLSQSELEAYSKPKEVKKERKQTTDNHELILSKRWDLNY